jgi:hypothetical protein
MGAVAEKADPTLWDKVKAEVTEADKGGAKGQWSARKAQLATQAYKKAGGRYKGRKTADNHLEQWQEEDWGTKSGHKSAETGERYLPKAARAHLTDAEYKRTSAKKRADSRKGVQVSAQPADIALKTARDRHTGADSKKGGPTKAALMQKAREQNIPGRSTMNKAALERALA